MNRRVLESIAARALVAAAACGLLVAFTGVPALFGNSQQFIVFFFFFFFFYVYVLRSAYCLTFTCYGSHTVGRGKKCHHSRRHRNTTALAANRALSTYHNVPASP